MSPLWTQKKRSPGRPKENKLIRELKVKTWFAAVAKASGKTAYELEKEFAPSYVDREEFGKHRARLWDKYRLGKATPTIKSVEGGRRPIALLVEDKYPGTLKWLTHPIWRVLDLGTEITMRDLHLIYETLTAEFGNLILDQNKNRLFWRKSIDTSIPLIAVFCKQKSFEAVTALVCLWRESLICQQKTLYDAILAAVKPWSKTNSSTVYIQSVSIILIQYDSKLSR